MPLLLVAYLSLFISVTPVSAAAGINQQLSFEGKLVNSDGTNIANGTYNMEFKIYQDGTNTGSGSTLKWTEDYLVSGSTGMPSTGGVTLSDGTFQVNLGSICAFSGGTCGAKTNTGVNWNQDTLWLSVQIGNASSCTVTSSASSFATGGSGNCNGDGEMSPYIRLTAVPQALNSNLLGGIAASGFIQNTTTAQTANFNVQSAGSGDIAAVIQGASGQSVDIAQIKADGVTAPLLAVADNGDITLQSADNSTTAFRIMALNPLPRLTSSTALVVDTTNGLIGIGTDTPTQTLDVYGVDATLSLNSVSFAEEESTANARIYLNGNRGNGGGDVGMHIGIDDLYGYIGGLLGGGLMVNGGSISYGLGPVNIGATAFNVTADPDNSSPAIALSVDTTTNQMTLGYDGTLVFTNSVGSNTVGLSLQADPSSSYTLLLPTTGPSVSQCLQTDATTATQLVFDSCSSGVTTIGTYSASNHYADGASISGSTLTLGSADATHPGLIDTGAQTFAGDKTFQSTTDSTSAFQIQNSAGSPVLSFDTTPLNNLLTNSNFENSNISAWVYYGTPGSVSRDATTAYNGGASLKVMTSANYYDGVKYVTGNGANALATNTTYTISWYESSASGGFVPTYNVDGSGDAYCANGTGINNSAGNWVRHTCQIITDGTTPSSGAYISLQQTDNTARTVWIDAIQIEASTTASLYRETAISLGGAITSPVAIRPASNSTSAFTIQDVNGNIVFNVDNINTKITTGVGFEAKSWLVAGPNEELSVDNHTFDVTSPHSAFYGDNASAFQIQDSTGTTNLFIADTLNSQIAINQATASYPLDVNGDINTTTGFRVGGTAGSTISTCGASNYVLSFASIGGLVSGGSCGTIASTNLSDTSNLARLDAANTFAPTTNNVGTTIKQTSGTATSGNIFDIQGANGTSHFLQVTETAANQGSISITSLGSNDLTLDSGSGLVKLGTNSTSLQKSATAFSLDITNGSDSTLTVTNSGAGVASLSVEGDVAIGSGRVYKVGATSGSTISACNSTQYVVSFASIGGLTSAGSCADAHLSNAYNTTATSGNTITLTQNGGGIVVQDASTAITGSNLFTVQSNGGLQYLSVSSSGVNVTSASDTATYTSELVTSQAFNNATYWSCSGWTTTSTTAQHNSGNTTVCSTTGTNLTVGSGQQYVVTFTVNGTSSTTESLSMSMGGGGYSTYGVAGATTFSFIINTINTNVLSFTPSSGYVSTVTSVSVKRLIQTASSNVNLMNSDSSIGIEIRSGGSGTQNNFIGVNSGLKNGTGSSNTSFGYSTLAANVGGSSNTAIGNYSLASNTSGYNNIGVGINSLTNNLNGGYNVAVGAVSLESNSSGGFNVGLGYSTLNSNLTGSSNTALGTNAMDVNTTGNNNTAVGNNAVDGNNSGSYNTGVGDSALGFITSGSNNTAVGSFAGAYDPAVSSFVTLSNLQNSTMVGYGAQAQASNVLVLGGAGSNAVNVGIGTTAPTNLFSVSPDIYDTGTAYQDNGSAGVAGTTIHGIGTTWTSSMVGMEFIFATGQKETISSFTSATQLTGSVSQAVGLVGTAKAYRIHNPAFYVSSTGSAQVRTSTNSTTAFQVQNAAGTVVFQVDTSNGLVKVNGSNVATSLSSAYNTAGTTGNTIGLTSSGAGILIQDNASPIGGNLFAVQKNAAGVTYLGVTATGINIQSNFTGSAVSALAFDTSTAVPHLKIYGANGTNYADIYYDSSTSTAYYGANTGTAVLGSGTGAVNITAGASAAVTITGNANSSFTTTAGSLTLQGGTTVSLLSTTSSTVTVDSGTTGNVNVGTGANAKAVSVGNNQSGSAYTLESGTASTAIQIGNGATAHGIQIGTGAAIQTVVVGSTNSSSATTIQGGSGYINLLTSTGNKVQIGSSTTDTNSTILVLDSYNNSGAAGDPTGVAGGMYYNTFSNTFRCYQNGAWTNCISPWIQIKKSADQDVTNNATPQDDSELQFTVSANTRYAVKFQIVFAGNNATGDYRWRFNCPSVSASSAAAANGYYQTYTSGAETVSATPTGSIATTAGLWPSADVTPGTDAALTPHLTMGEFTIAVGSSGGSCKLQFANSAAASGRTSRTMAGSILEYQAL